VSALACLALLLGGALTAAPAPRADHIARLATPQPGAFLLRSVIVRSGNPVFGPGPWQAEAHYDISISALRDELGLGSLPTVWCPLERHDGGADVVLTITFQPGMPDSTSCSTAPRSVSLGGRLCASAVSHRGADAQSAGYEMARWWQAHGYLFSLKIQSGTAALRSPSRLLDEGARAVAAWADEVARGAPLREADATHIEAALERAADESKCAAGFTR
jgi:hypothetical protein